MHNYGFGLECDVGYIRFIHSVTRSTTPWKLFEMLLLSAFVLLSGFVRNLTYIGVVLFSGEFSPGKSLSMVAGNLHFLSRQTPNLLQTNDNLKGLFSMVTTKNKL